MLPYRRFNKNFTVALGRHDINLSANVTLSLFYTENTTLYTLIVNTMVTVEMVSFYCFHQSIANPSIHFWNWRHLGLKISLGIVEVFT